ncbi:MAG: phosphoribosylglycinamide formyltransferase [Candidatus Gygaella obscura]|nr:phosphoribosylglycinamide formyltransferase [Candidatus Gygaella obscura]
MKNIAILASGNGSNFAAIKRAIKDKKIKANLKLLVCDKLNAFVLKRAKKEKVKSVLIERRLFSSRANFENAIIAVLKENKIDLIVLAGFMRILSSNFVKKYRNKILNIHPALLPAFKGAHAIKDAFIYGVKYTGVTVHFVDEKTDHGPIIAQAIVPIVKKDTLKSLEAKIHKLEYQIYPAAINLVLKSKARLKGRRVI